MTAQIARLSAIRPRKAVTLPGCFVMVREALGLPNPGPWIAFELWGRGKRSYVMLTDGRLRLNVSLDKRFAGRDEARKWARAYLAGLGMEGLPERPKRFR